MKYWSELKKLGLVQGLFPNKAFKSVTVAKGQIISKANFEVFIGTKNRTKIFLYFCPRSLKWIKSKKEYKLLY